MVKANILHSLLKMLIHSQIKSNLTKGNDEWQYNTPIFIFSVRHPINASLYFFEARQIHIELGSIKRKEADVKSFRAPLINLLIFRKSILQLILKKLMQWTVIVLIDESVIFVDEAFLENIAAIEGFHDIVLLAYLSIHYYCRGISTFLRANNVSPSYWEKRNDFPSLLLRKKKDIRVLVKVKLEFLNFTISTIKNTFVLILAFFPSIGRITAMRHRKQPALSV